MFTCVIPCHNDIDVLRLNLTGFSAQFDCDVPFEIIVVDNNSEEQNPDTVYCEFYGRLDLTLIRQAKMPHPFALCRARNIGIKLAKYPWIITVDSDCVPNPHYLRQLAHLLDCSDDVMLTGERVFIHPDGIDSETLANDPTVLERQPQIESVSNYFVRGDRRFPDLHRIAECKHPWALMHGGNSIFPASLAMRVGGYDESYDGCWGYEDVDLAYRLITGGARPIFAEGIQVYHLERDGDTVDRADKRNNPNWLRIVSKIDGFAEFKAKQFARVGAQAIL